MKTLYPITLAALFLSPASFAESNDTDTNLPTLLETRIEAEAIDRPFPAYPRILFNKGIEGWVKLSYVISDEGEVTSVAVIDSSGQPRIDSVAKTAVKKWSFKPAQVDGENVEQCNTTVHISFGYNKKKQALRKNFRRHLLKGIEHAENKDEVSLRGSVATLEKLGIKLLAEQSWLNLLKAHLSAIEGNELAQLSHLNHALPTAKELESEALLPKPQVVSLLEQMFVIEYNNSLLSNAMATFEKLDSMKSDEAKQVAEQLRPHYDKLDDIIKSEKVLTVSAEVSKYGNFYHDLVRSEFSITEVKGDLDKIDIMCKNKHFVYSVKDQSQWKIPESFGKCHLIVEGEAGSQFKLREVQSS